MKRFIGWLAEFYPGHHFFSSTFLQDMDWSIHVGEHHYAHSSDAATALLAVGVAASRNLKVPGASISADFTNVTGSGRDVGSFRVTVERLG